MQQLLNILTTVRPFPTSFRNHPREGFTELDYDLTVESVAASFIQTPGVSAVYQYGSVSAPGISDIDFLVVLEPDSPTKISQFRTSPFGARIHYLTKHPALVLNYEHAKRFHYWDIHRPTLVAGEDCISFDFADVSRESLCLELALDRTFQIYPRHLLRLYFKARPDARDTLTCLYSLRYVEELLEQASIPVDSQNEFHSAVASLRAEWFRLSRRTQDAELNDLLRRGICASFSLVASIYRALRIVQRSESTQSGEFRDFDFLSVFEEPWGPLESLRSTLDKHSTTATLVMHLPKIYLARLAEYAASPGTHSDYLRRQLRVYDPHDIEPIESLAGVWLRRAEFVNSHTDWLQNKGYHHGDSLNGNENALSGGLRGLVRRLVKQRILGWLALQSGTTSPTDQKMPTTLTVPLLRMATAALDWRSQKKGR